MRSTARNERKVVRANVGNDLRIRSSSRSAARKLNGQIEALVKGVLRRLVRVGIVQDASVNASIDMRNGKRKGLQNAIAILRGKLMIIRELGAVNNALNDAKARGNSSLGSDGGTVRLLVENKHNLDATPGITGIGNAGVVVTTSDNANIDSLENALAAVTIRLASSTRNEIQRRREHNPVGAVSDSVNEINILVDVVKLEFGGHNGRLCATVLAAILKAASACASWDYTARAKAAATSAKTGAT